MRDMDAWNFWPNSAPCENNASKVWSFCGTQTGARPTDIANGAGVGTRSCECRCGAMLQWHGPMRWRQLKGSGRSPTGHGLLRMWPWRDASAWQGTAPTRRPAGGNGCSAYLRSAHPASARVLARLLLHPVGVAHTSRIFILVAGDPDAPRLAADPRRPSHVSVVYWTGPAWLRWRAR